MTTKIITSRIIPIITVEMYWALLRKGKAPIGYNYIHLLTLTNFGQEQPVRGIWVEPLTEIETTVGTYLVANWRVESCWDLSTALYGQGIDTDFLNEDFHILPHSQLCDAPAPVEVAEISEPVAAEEVAPAAPVAAQATSSEVKVMDVETFLAVNGASMPQNAALHRSSNKISRKVWSKMVDHQAAESRAVCDKRQELREEYQRLVDKGEMRPPTRKESLMQTASGHPDNESVQAARRLVLKHYGMQWDDHRQEFTPVETAEVTTQGEITESDVNFTDGEWDTTPTPNGSNSGNTPDGYNTLKSAVSAHFNAAKATKSLQAYYLAFWRGLHKANTCTHEMCDSTVTITRLEKGDFAVSAQSQPVAPVVIAAEDKPQPTIKRTNQIKRSKKRMAKLPNLIGEIMSPRDFASMIGMPIYKLNITAAPLSEIPAPEESKSYMEMVRNGTPSEWVEWIKQNPLNENDFWTFKRACDCKIIKGITYYFFDGVEICSHFSGDINQCGLRSAFNEYIANNRTITPDWHTIIDEIAISDFNLIDSSEWADLISEAEMRFDAELEIERDEMAIDDYDAEQAIERKNSLPVPRFELLATKQPAKAKRAGRAKFVQITPMLFDTPKVSTNDLIARRAAQRKALGDRLPPAPLFR